MKKVKWKGKTEFLMLTHDKIYDVISVEKGWYRVIDDSGDDYLYPPEQFEIVDKEVPCPQLCVSSRQRHRRQVMSDWQR